MFWNEKTQNEIENEVQEMFWKMWWSNKQEDVIKENKTPYDILSETLKNIRQINRRDG